MGNYHWVPKFERGIIAKTCIHSVHLEQISIYFSIILHTLFVLTSFILRNFTFF